MPLTDTACRNSKPAEKSRKLSDGGGLFLLVQPSGSKLWRYAYRHAGKQKTLAIGAYPEVSLKDARRKHFEARAMLADGIDPSAHKRRLRQTKQAAAKNTFEALAREWFEAKRSGWTQGYADRLLSRLNADLIPPLGKRPIEEIDPPELLAAIRSIEARGAIELAKRMLQVAGQIFRFAVASGRANRDPSQDLKGALKTPPPPKRRSALKATELPEFFSRLRAYDGDRSTVLALKLTIHTILRTAEVRFGEWKEIEGLDGDEPIWRIPGQRMKMRSEHLVPLSPAVVDMLTELKALSAKSEKILPGPGKDGVISSNTLIGAMYRLGYHSRATVHGFRSTASTVLNENGFQSDWIERQLAHVERNEVRAAYNAAEYLPQRRDMMLWWSNFLSQQSGSGG